MLGSDIPGNIIPGLSGRSGRSKTTGELLIGFDISVKQPAIVPLKIISDFVIIKIIAPEGRQ